MPIAHTKNGSLRSQKEGARLMRSASMLKLKLNIKLILEISLRIYLQNTSKHKAISHRLESMKALHPGGATSRKGQEEPGKAQKEPGKNPSFCSSKKV